MGERVKLYTARKRKKLTQQEMADKIGVARSTYSGYEKGMFSPPIDTAIKIKKVLGYKSDNLFYEKKTENETINKQQAENKI